MPLSVRLDPKTQGTVSRLARRTGQTKSVVVRQAIAAFERAQTTSGASRPWHKLAHLIGVADSGGRDLSIATGEKFRELVREKARARRTR